MNQTLYDELLRLARGSALATYSDVARLIGLSMDNGNDREKISNLLGEIARFEHENNRPMLTALIIHRGNDNNPGEGFFAIATEFELFDGSRDGSKRVDFWSQQVKQVYNHWANA